YVTAQTLGQFAMAALLSAFVVSRFGADGGFAALAALCLGALPLALLLPRELAPLPALASAGLPGARGWTALAASFLFIALSGGVWVYIEQLSRQAHHGGEVAGQAVSVSLALQVAGGMAATVLAGRINWLWALIGCALGDLAIFAGFASL